MNTDALHHKLPKRLAEVKVATLVTLLSDIKAEPIIDTLADTLTDVEKWTNLAKQWPKDTQNFLSENWPKG